MKIQKDVKSEKLESKPSKILTILIDFIGGTINSKIGFGLLLVVLGLVTLLSPIEGLENKPISLIVLGWILLIYGLSLIIRKINKSIFK